VTSATLRMKRITEHGRKVVEVQLPERVLRHLKLANPDTVRFRFGLKDIIEIDAGELKEAIVETHKRKNRRGARRC